MIETILEIKQKENQIAMENIRHNSMEVENKLLKQMIQKEKQGKQSHMDEQQRIRNNHMKNLKAMELKHNAQISTLNKRAQNISVTIEQYKLLMNSFNHSSIDNSNHNFRSYKTSIDSI